MASLLAEKMQKLGFIEIVYKVEINMVYFKFTDERIEIAKFQNFMKENGIKVNEDADGVFKFMTHFYIREEQVSKVIESILQFIKSNIQE